MNPAQRPARNGIRLVGALMLASLALLGGCRTARNKNVTAESLYTTAHKAMEGSDYQYAIKQYEELTARFPFSSQARQARLDLIYVYYRKGDKDSTTDAADQFLRENPTHPRVDYAWYMKGLVNFEKTPISLERWLGVDMAKKPPTTAMTAIADFNTVVTRYPKSEYAHDAERRIIYLRNRLAEYNIFVADYYVRRGAYVAAARRAQDVLTNYEGAPSERRALLIMIDCYQRLGYKTQEDNARRIYEANFAGTRDESAGVRRHWWQFWRSKASST